MNLLDRRITVEVNTETQDSQGTPIATWSAYATRWAKKMNLVGGTGEDYDSNTRVAYQGTDWLILMDQLTKGITPKMRVLYAGEYYDIDSIEEDTDKRRNGYLLIHSIKRGTING